MVERTDAPPGTDGSNRAPGTERGFRHVHDDESLRAYRALSPEQRLAWLHAAWQFTVDFLPESARRAHERMRRGQI